MLLTRMRNGLALPDVSFFPFVEPVVRIEEHLEDGHYTVRAELPGVDVTKDVDITTQHGRLRLVVRRMEPAKEGGRSEFRYGTFHRIVGLPSGTKEETICANYTDGILTITVPIDETKKPAQKIAVTRE